MARCGDHNKPIPCYYCALGLPPFPNLECRVEYLERLVEKLAKTIDSSPTKEINQAIGVVREGGIGDLVMMIPGLRALKEQNPSRPLALVTRKENHDLFADAPYLDMVLPLEFAAASFHHTIDLRYAVEPPEVNLAGKLPLKDYKTRDRSDIFDELMGVESDKNFSLQVAPELTGKWMERFKNLPRPLIGLAPMSKQLLREIPVDYVEPIVHNLMAMSHGTVVLIGNSSRRHKGLTIREPGIVNLIDQTSLSDAMAVVSLLDFLVAPESGTLYLGAGFNIRTLLLSGCIDPKCRVKHLPTVTPLSARGELPCLPCHAISIQPRHKALPCKQPGKVVAECMRLLTPERIVAKANEAWGWKRGVVVADRKPRVAFLHDLDLNYWGGAERSSKYLVDHAQGFEVDVFSINNSMADFNRLGEYDLIILSNLWQFNYERMDVIREAVQTVPFVRYEHDYRCLDEKPGGKYPQSLAIEFFRNSLLNLFLSPQHLRDHADALGVTGVLFPPPIDVKTYKPVRGVRRQANTALVAVPKKMFNKCGYRPSIDGIPAFMENHKHWEFTLLEKKVPAEEMPVIYSTHEYLVHLPQGRWACDRVPLEGALCGCKVVTNENSGVPSWNKKMETSYEVRHLRKWLETSPEVFWDHIRQAMKDGPIYQMLQWDRGLTVHDSLVQGH